ncbi:hypothetical protein BANRA_04360 [Escherichia coli]|nr:hypothetical protein BANRA_04360 [Escherichia coli]
MGLTKFSFGCGISIASILKYNEGNQLCFHIFTDYFGDDDRKYFDARRNIKQELRYI